MILVNKNAKIAQTRRGLTVNTINVLHNKCYSSMTSLMVLDLSVGDTGSVFRSRFGPRDHSIENILDHRTIKSFLSNPQNHNKSNAVPSISSSCLQNSTPHFHVRVQKSQTQIHGITTIVIICINTSYLGIP